MPIRRTKPSVDPDPDAVVADHVVQPVRFVLRELQEVLWSAADHVESAGDQALPDRAYGRISDEEMKAMPN